MSWILYIILILVSLASLYLVLITLPGLWLMLAASAGYAAATRGHFIGWHSLIALAILAMLAEVLELGIGGAAAARAGGGKRAMLGGAIGAVAGGIFLTFIPVPILGTVVGVCLGSFLGAAFFEMLGGKRFTHSAKVGAGSAAGRFAGILAKLAVGLAMILLILIAGWP